MGRLLGGAVAKESICSNPDLGWSHWANLGVAEFSHVHNFVDAWIKRENRFVDEGNHNAGITASKWMGIVGGISLANIKTEYELLTSAYIAPDGLLFGLAHGKLADALAHSERHDIDLTWGKATSVNSFLWNAVLERGRKAITVASELNPGFYEMMTIRGSREDLDTLLEQIVNAPDDYAFGQLSSWLMTSHQVRQRHGENIPDNRKNDGGRSRLKSA